tara:strand:- start:795 stop:1067 length:273 start_codon:yes stop_codon:yes gene_type:complete
MDKNKFLEIVSIIYSNSREFWENEFPLELDKNLKLTGKESLFSSLELVTFLAEIETELLNFKINISFLDKIYESKNEDISIEALYKLINQ